MPDEPEVLDLPVSSLRDAAPYLRRPFTPEAIKFKVQTVFKQASGCLVVAYIDARLVVERLNLVVPDMWSARYEPIDGTKLMWCHLTITGEQTDTDWRVTHSDVGESPKGMSKDLVSDALKRAAVHFGVGVSVYALPQIALYVNDAKGRIEKRSSPKGDTIVLTEHGHEHLRGRYRAWLEQKPHGFGAALGHGDVEGATLDEDDVAPEEEFTPAAPTPLDDPRATELREQIKTVYGTIRDVDPRAVPPAKYNAWLIGAQHSHEELEKLLAHLETRKAEVLGS